MRLTDAANAIHPPVGSWSVRWFGDLGDRADSGNARIPPKEEAGIGSREVDREAGFRSGVSKDRKVRILDVGFTGGDTILERGA